MEKELMEKLPLESINVNIEKGVASYYDFYGVTFREYDSEQKFVDDYVMDSVAKKAGFPIIVTKWTDGNGHFSLHFKRV